MTKECTHYYIIIKKNAYVNNEANIRLFSDDAEDIESAMLLCRSFTIYLYIQKTDEQGNGPCSSVFFLIFALQCLEEVVALVVYEDESREVLHLYLPYSLHAEFGIFNAFDALDGVHG